jgi:putative two-component system response regulator
MSNRRKILIVDDSEMNRSLLSDMLSNQFDIMEAENGVEAAAILTNHEDEISLMLLDIVMPVMDGFEMLALMNKKGWIKSIPVIMISAETVPAYVDRAYDLGAIEYISRPFDERTVRHRVVSSIMLTAKQKELSHMLTEQMYEKEKTSRLMIEILSNIVEFRNGESGLHVLHIQTITEMLLDSLAVKTNKYTINGRDRNLICIASALHDIGKIAIPSKILNKAGRLTPEEYEIMKTHAAEGARILNNIPLGENEPLIQFGHEICRWHHERYDGRGYPDGLKGEEIPIAAQVVALADVYDALISRRVYKEPYSHEKAVEMIQNGECGAFNPILIECLLDISDELEKEIHLSSLGDNTEKNILKTVDQMAKANKLNASERTLHLLEREKTRYQFLADSSHDILFEYSAMPEVITLTEWSSDYLGLPETIVNPREDAFGTQVFSRNDFAHLLDSLKNTTPENPVVEEKYLLKIHGCQRWNKVVARSIWSSEEMYEYEGAIGKIIDIHDDMETMKQLEKLATLDSLTGLLNYDTARWRISSILSARGEEQYALFVVDMDNFKHVNDTYGHLFGNEVLKHMADTIKSNIRSEDIAARLGGDEFIIFMGYKDSIESQARRIFESLSENYKGIECKVSMGIALTEECDGNYEMLLHMADTAMYAVKHESKDGCRFYDENMEKMPAAGCQSPAPEILP